MQGRQAMTISLGRRLPDASSSRPGRNGETGRFTSADTGRSRNDRTSSCLALLPMGFTEPDRSPGLLVSSYLTVSPLPAERTPPAVCFLWHFPWPHGRWALPTIAPCGARTFLPPGPPRHPGAAIDREPAITRSAPVLQKHPMLASSAGAIHRQNSRPWCVFPILDPRTQRQLTS